MNTLGCHHWNYYIFSSGFLKHSVATITGKGDNPMNAHHNPSEKP